VDTNATLYHRPAALLLEVDIFSSYRLGEEQGIWDYSYKLLLVCIVLMHALFDGNG
jgi:hypothetical protein